jgi:hypothetical protein
MLSFTLPAQFPEIRSGQSCIYKSLEISGKPVTEIPPLFETVVGGFIVPHLIRVQLFHPLEAQFPHFPVEPGTVGASGKCGHGTGEFS